MLPVAKPLDFQNDCWDNCLMFTALGSGALSLPEQNASFFQFKPEVTGGPWGLGPATPLDTVHWKSHPSGQPLRSILWVHVWPLQLLPYRASSHTHIPCHTHAPQAVTANTCSHHKWSVYAADATKWKEDMTTWVLDLPGDRGAGPESENGPVHSGHHCGVGIASFFNPRKSGFESSLSQ